MRIDAIRHPYYEYWYPQWEKFRLTFEGGEAFIEAYVKKFNIREDDTDFQNRKDISYCPAHAKAAVIDIRNSIFQRMVDIIRSGGAKTYEQAVIGHMGGVDLNGSTMNSFVGRILLPELLVMGRVGVYVDKPAIPENPTLKDTKNKRPYLYYYQAEDILSWSFNDENQLDVLLLRDYDYQYDDNTGLIVAEISRYRLLKLTSDGVTLEFFSNKIENHSGTATSVPDGPAQLLKLNRIPFVIFELSCSLLIDIADCQIALVNLASSDINYALKSNFPFYTEQFNPTSDMPFIRPGGPGDGTSVTANKASDRKIDVGVAQGRKYPKDVERPGFIHPSPEPLRASMEKQDKLIADIRTLVNLSLSNLKPTRSSADSKEMDQTGLEAGLSYIGLELEHGERAIAEIWADYESFRGESATIKYPDAYNLRSDDDRRREAKELRDLLPTIPSLTFQKSIAKQIAKVTIGTKISASDWEKIEGEIDKSSVIVSDPTVVQLDHEAGFVSTETASKLRGYPEGEVEQAKKDHMERAKRILAAQTAGAGAEARGAPDAGMDPSSAEKEKAQSRDNTLQDKVQDRTRGEGK